MCPSKWYIWFYTQEGFLQIVRFAYNFIFLRIVLIFSSVLMLCFITGSFVAS